jgi:Domain of unknown function (DUF5658)
MVGVAATSASNSSATVERRNLSERRSQTVRALVAGGWHARRRNMRRSEPARVGFVDWHASRWFAAALIVLLLSMADTLLTLVLVQHGATEVNPLMEPFVIGSGPAFAFLKLALTATAVFILVALTRVPTFGRLLAGPILVGAALLYTILLGYEMWLLDRLLG